MAKQVATAEAVFDAAEALLDAGIEPTAILVRERTGGSYTTVRRHLDTWHAKRRDAGATVDVPPDVQTRGTALVSELYALAYKNARAANAEPLERAAAALKAAEDRAAGAEAEVARLEGVEQRNATDIERLELRILELERSEAGQQATLQEKTASLARLEDQYAQSQARLSENIAELSALRALTKSADALHRQLEQLQRSVQGLAGGKHG